MNTVITKTTEQTAKGWIFYDGDCRLCLGLARRWEAALARRQFGLAPLQAPWVRERLGVHGRDLLREMRMLTPDGRVFSGACALISQVMPNYVPEQPRKRRFAARLLGYERSIAIAHELRKWKPVSR